MARVLLIGFTFYSVIFLVSKSQAERINQFGTYVQPKTAKEATTIEAINQIEELTPQIAEIQRRTKVLQNQITKTQALPWYLFVTIAILGVTLGTAFFIFLQVKVARKTRQEEVFLSLVSELNKINFYPQNDDSTPKERLKLLGKLHNYLDGIEEILRREGMPSKLSFLKKAEKEITQEEKDKLRTLLDKLNKYKLHTLFKEKTSYYLRILRWYKYVQKYYIHLDPKEEEILFHLKELGAVSDPHINEDYFAPMESFNIREVPSKILGETKGKVIELQKRRVIMTTLWGAIFGIICMLQLRYLVGISFWPLGVGSLIHHSVMGFTIGTSSLKIHWAPHGILWGFLFGIFLTILYQAQPVPWVALGFIILWGFLIELITTVGFKLKMGK